MSSAPVRSGRPRGLLVALAVGAAMAVAGIEVVLLLLASGAGTVVVQRAAFEANTPPTTFCPYWFTTGGPPEDFAVRSGSIFSLSWGIGCEPYGPGNTTGATFVIRTVDTSSWGFSVVGSNVPVTFGYNQVGQFNVSVRAPPWFGYGSLTLLVTGGPSSVR